jgi:hypothetical protein
MAAIDDVATGPRPPLACRLTGGQWLAIDGVAAARSWPSAAVLLGRWWPSRLGRTAGPAGDPRDAGPASAG